MIWPPSLFQQKNKWYTSFGKLIDLEVRNISCALSVYEVLSKKSPIFTCQILGLHQKTVFSVLFFVDLNPAIEYY